VAGHVSTPPFTQLLWADFSVSCHAKIGNSRSQLLSYSDSPVVALSWGSGRGKKGETYHDDRTA